MEFFNLNYLLDYLFGHYCNLLFVQLRNLYYYLMRLWDRNLFILLLDHFDLSYDIYLNYSFINNNFLNKNFFLYWDLNNSIYCYLNMFLMNSYKRDTFLNNYTYLLFQYNRSLNDRLSDFNWLYCDRMCFS